MSPVFHDMRGTLAFATDLIHKTGGYFVAWTERPRYTRGEYKHLLCSELAMNVLSMYKGRVYFTRMPYRQKRNAPTGPRLSYDMQALYQITTGIRKDSIVRPDEIRANEDYTMSVFHKELVYGFRPYLFNETHTNDVAVIDLLHGLHKFDSYVCMDAAIPQIYLTIPMDDSRRRLCLRNTALAIGYLRSLDGYDPRLSLERNLQELIHEGEAVGGDRIGHPYEFVYGPGALVFDMQLKDLRKWIHVPDIQLELTHVEVLL